MKMRRFVAGTVGVMVLSVSLLLLSANPGAQAAPPITPVTPGDQAILNKLDQVLAAITGAAGQGNHTLRWDTNNASATRFTTAFTGAVLDKNTGLVWEQAPDATPRNWATALEYCLNRDVGGTRGWRLPSVVELVSLIDPSLPAPFVPGTVFTGVQSDGVLYWSATFDAGNASPGFAWVLTLASPSGAAPSFKATPLHSWCVRGGMNADAY